MGASLRETRTQADVNIYPVIQEMRDAVTGVFSSLKRLLEDYFHVPESRMRSSRQRGDQKRLRDNRDRTPCSPMPALLGERWNCQIAVRAPDQLTWRRPLAWSTHRSAYPFFRYALPDLYSSVVYMIPPQHHLLSGGCNSPYPEVV